MGLFRIYYVNGDRKRFNPTKQEVCKALELDEPSVYWSVEEIEP